MASKANKIIEKSHWFKDAEDRIQKFVTDNSKGRLMFLAGPLGSGKTTIIDGVLLNKPFKKSFFKPNVFLGFNNPENALIRSYPLLIRFSLGIFLAAIMLRASLELDWGNEMLIITISTALLISAFSYAEIIAILLRCTTYLFECSCMYNIKTILVIEDLERSAMDLHQSMNYITLLLNHTKYDKILVGISWCNKFNKPELLEWFQKLEAETVILQSDPATLYRIASNYFQADLPFSNDAATHSWLSLFTCRECLELIDECRTHNLNVNDSTQINNHDKILINFFILFLRELVSKINLTEDQIHHLVIRSIDNQATPTSTVIQISRNTPDKMEEFTPSKQNMIESFARSYKHAIYNYPHTGDVKDLLEGKPFQVGKFREVT